ncbi:hypothetical protein N7510_007306 [Penicillium lagena]|uniref:uncharacterized protein n=1 Tax=Penicillium lagena TaxID=94218 RepID=UPI0025422386|nr:uncharacterized protein N7510_007306 [Penicillium lagena]KAJ5610587.1 hypothetical protein N7510_007306 [Penicillium lagena]
MSQRPLRPGSWSEDVPQSDAERAGPVGKASRRSPLRTRPQSWHPYGPVEPPLDSSTQLRPIGVHAILNHPEQATAEAGSRGRRESLGLPAPSSSPRSRQGSLPSARPVHPLAQQRPLSPRTQPHSMLTPESPSARFVGGAARSSGPSSVVQSPLISVSQEPSRHPASTSPLPLDSMLRPITSLPPASTSLHSTPTLHSRRSSKGPSRLTTPNSQETSPTTPHSTSGPFSRASPAMAPVSFPPSVTAYSTAPPYGPADPMNRTAGPRPADEGGVGLGLTAQNTQSLGGGGVLIPCVLDLKSGSSTQAEKRKANSDASRRFRTRKRNEMQLELRITAQEEEIQKSGGIIRRQTEEIRALMRQRDHYRSERDFFRDHLSRSGSLNQLPARPASPPPPTPAPAAVAVAPMEAGTTPGGDLSRSASSSQPSSTGPVPSAHFPDPARPPGSWTGSPTPYSPAPPTHRGLAPAGPPSVTGGLCLHCRGRGDNNLCFSFLSVLFFLIPSAARRNTVAGMTAAEGVVVISISDSKKRLVCFGRVY